MLRRLETAEPFLDSAKPLIKIFERRLRAAARRLLNAIVEVGCLEFLEQPLGCCSLAEINRSDAERALELLQVTIRMAASLLPALDCALTHANKVGKLPLR